MKLYDINPEDFLTLENSIDFHDQTRGSYFWNPSSVANGRRSNEKKWNSRAINNTINIIEKTKKGDKIHQITIKQSYSESCKHVYVISEFYFNNKKTTITKIKNILISMENITAKAIQSLLKSFIIEFLYKNFDILQFRKDRIFPEDSLAL